MKLAIYGQSYPNKSVTNALIQLLNVIVIDNEDHEIWIETDFFEEHQVACTNFKVRPFTTLDASFDILISIGGDGTILRAATYIRNLSIPIIGINTGRLGFLATIRPDAITHAFAEISSGNYTISERTLLAVTTSVKNEAIDTINFALNEVTVSRKNTTSMITVDTHLDNEYLTSYWSDGLILSTPTGSTGYSLSCGGPVILPTAGNFVITPIAPHNLNARPLVIPDTTTIQLKVSGREHKFLLSLDSRIVTLPNTAIVTVKKADFCIKMIALSNQSFLKTLRKKMLWGEDHRNASYMTQ